MRKFLSLFLVAAVGAFAATALAGDCSSGFRCTNACPLAKQANRRRATGSEAARVSEKVRRDAARVVARNLGRI